MVSSSERVTEENGAKKTALSKSSAFQQRTAALKPLCKHTFYLDVKNRSVLAKIEGKIRALGGNIELFLDKDVTHIVTDKEIPAVNSRQDIKSPITPKQIGENKSVDSQKGGHGGDRTPNHVTGRLKTRVSAMLEKARGTPTQIEKDIFTEAERLGITVWTIEKGLTWLDKVALSLKPPSRHSSTLGSRYNFRDLKYYIKFESFDRRSRPVFRELPSWPRVNLCGAAAGDAALLTTPPAHFVPSHRNMTRTTVPPTAAVINANSIIRAANPGKTPQQQDVLPKEPEVDRVPPHPAILNLNQRLQQRLSSTKLKQINVPLQEKQQPVNTAKEEANNIPGYCELCRVNFTQQYEHFGSEKHLKFVGDAKNYTEVDDLISKSRLEQFLTLNNYQVPSSTIKDNSNSPVLAMSSTRSFQTRAGSVGGGTSTRPRRHTTFNNSYLEISVDDDLMRPPECARETRSARHSQTKAPSPESDTFWTSGRPKRACIKRKRSSTEDKPPMSSNQAYYRVEVCNSKALRSTTETVNVNSTHVNSTKHHAAERSVETSANESKTTTTTATANSREENGDDKGLIVKFRRMRNSELKQLNNEAVNFLFPRKDDSSSEEDIDDNCPETTVSSGKAAEISVVISSEDDETVDEINETDTKEQIRTNKNKEEVDTDENHSLDSNWSDSNAKKNLNHKRRRTHAEAFINDNQKYYKFETPGSRLRYQGTFMSTHDLNTEQSIRPRFNGENPIDAAEDSVVESSEEDPECKPEAQTTRKLRLEDVKYSYEMRPASEPWYQTFVRQDQGLEHYSYHKSFSEGGAYKPFYLPHQLPPLQPLDPRVCFAAYERLKRLILEETDISPNPTPCSSTGNSTPTNNEPSTTKTAQQQEDTATNSNNEQPAAEILLNGTNNDIDESSVVDVKIEVVGQDVDEVDSLDMEEGSSCNSSHGQGSLEGENAAEEEAVADSKDTTRIDLEQRRQQRQRQKRLMKAGTSGRSPGRNSRKSPRQHASTLAILSLLQQRKRRDAIRSKSGCNASLDTIQEQEELAQSTSAQSLSKHPADTSTTCCIEPQSIAAQELAKLMSTIDRMNAAIAAETDDIEDFHVDISVPTEAETPLLQCYSKTDAIAILEDYEKHKNVLSKTGLSHGANKRSYSPGKKPGRKRKKKRKNMTGWPNVVKKLNVGNCRKEMDESTMDSLSVTAESEDDTNDVTLPTDANESEDIVGKFETDEDYDVKLFNMQLTPLSSPKPPTNRTSRINSRTSVKSDKKTNCNSAFNNVSDTKNRVQVKEETLSEDDSLSNCKQTKIIDLSHHCFKTDHKSETATGANFQPVVRVEKMNNRQLRSSGVGFKGKSKSVSRSPPVRSGSPPRAQRPTSRRMPASPRSPRVLRKPRGRWYRER